ncbi:D-ribose pyranase [Anoxybacillus tengchongensis]|uniref:D-ribose pyranase n=1 Tax=Anoxybacillus tengchongensis TaxID=576944 RepID=A0A7W9YPP6_9BACL|nr:D-ribose pyranase [Anoxybacillus tengchongensis]MBB6176067.1 D-ribose pyranase [Anoxybacillus tengchongensis]
MKKHGVLNKELNTVFASLGHTDMIVLADCGLPIPEGVKRIDLSVVKGFPSFLSVLDPILEELQIEAITIAEEIQAHNPAIYQEIQKRFADTTKHVVSHEQLKEMMKSAKAVIRTGEATPYANMILHSGVNF